MKLSVFQKILLLAGLYGLFSSIVSASQPSLSNPNLVKLSQSVYALIGEMAVPNEKNQGFISNSVFIITAQGVVVVDPGGSRQIGEMVIAEIRKVTSKPITHIINTHHHADHWMGNDAFGQLVPRPAILGHEWMRAQANEIGEQWLKIMGDMTKGANKGTQVVLPDMSLSGNETLNIGGTSFRFFHPPHAHTRGDIAVYLAAESVLIAGDIHFYKRTPGFQDASPVGNLRALRELSKLKPEHVIPGHGPVTDMQGLKYMIDYIELLHDEVTRLYEEGLEDFEMKDKIRIGDFNKMSGFKSRFGINVNRMFLEVEAESLK